MDCGQPVVATPCVAAISAHASALRGPRRRPAQVVLQPQYNGMAADIWSMGVVLLELLCSVRVVEQTLGITQRTLAEGSGAAVQWRGMPRCVVIMPERPRLRPLPRTGPQLISGDLGQIGSDFGQCWREFDFRRMWVILEVTLPPMNILAGAI